MPGEEGKLLSIDCLRHAEYYGMQEIFDDLYARSANGEKFPNLMKLILKRENILLAYRNIKTNKGSHTPVTDGLTIEDVGKLTPHEVVETVRYVLTGSPHGYRPKPVRRKEIPKPNGSTRPLGIPCIWDRLIQQCIKQILEPICEAKFSNNSYGFRPDRSTEHAVASVCRLIQLSHLHFVVEFDIKGFFDNVNHPKLIRQMWTLGIQDTFLLSRIRSILKAPIRMPDGTIMHPDRGTPQGGIISPLLANIVLNELDHWVDGQWQENPVTDKYSQPVNKNGVPDKSGAYCAMRKTKLKEMYIVRYADDFRILCRNRQDAERVKTAVTQWLADRLKLEVSPEKTRIVDVRERSSDFLGIKIKARQKGPKYVVESHISDKKMKQEKENLIQQAKRIARPRDGKTERDEIMFYNTKVMGIQNYFSIATHISLDCHRLHRAVMTVLTNRLGGERGTRLTKTGRNLTAVEEARYGRSKMLRYVAGSKEPIYPVGYVRYRTCRSKKRSTNRYTPEGRKELHDNLRINISVMLDLMRQPQRNRSTELADNRISRFTAQQGKCAVSGWEFATAGDVVCHHKTPKEAGGDDQYDNLVLVTEPIHILIHAVKEDVIQRYLNVVNLDKDQLTKLNKLRVMAGNDEIAA